MMWKGITLRIVEYRTGWWLLAGSALLLEVTALWFQHGMHLDPCVMCIYERVALFGLVLAGLAGATYPRSLIVRLVAYLIWIVSAVWGLLLALEHVGIQFNQSAALSCSFAAEFPSWLKLDEWLPALFLPTGYCDDIQWQWLSLTMAEWVVVVFAVYLVVLAVVLYLELRGRR